MWCERTRRLWKSQGTRVERVACWAADSNVTQGITFPPNYDSFSALRWPNLWHTANIWRLSPHSFWLQSITFELVCSSVLLHEKKSGLSSSLCVFFLPCMLNCRQVRGHSSDYGASPFSELGSAWRERGWGPALPPSPRQHFPSLHGWQPARIEPLQPHRSFEYRSSKWQHPIAVLPHTQLASGVPPQVAAVFLRSPASASTHPQCPAPHQHPTFVLPGFPAQP